MFEFLKTKFVMAYTQFLYKLRKYDAAGGRSAFLWMLIEMLLSPANFELGNSFLSNQSRVEKEILMKT